MSIDNENLKQHVNIEKVTDPSDSSKKVWKVSVTIPAGVDDENRIGLVKLLSKHDEIDGNGPSSNIQMSYVQRGPVGPSAEQGKALYPAGNWTAQSYSISEYSVPYVYHNNKYYVLTENAPSTAIPGTSSGSAYWYELSHFGPIYSSFLLAKNTTFGSEYGSIIYDNFMYSQKGLNELNQSCSYYEYVDEIFKNISTDNENIVKLTGVFRPNTSIDFFAGSISCNKLCEQFEYFSPIDMDFSDGVKFNNVHEIDLNKSHNLCILPRFCQYITGENVIEIASRPGVVVFPKYIEESRYNDGLPVEDGTHVCISYPNCPPEEINYITPDTDYKYVGGELNPGVKIEDPTLHNECNYGELKRYIMGYEPSSLVSGYILLCFDDIYNYNNYDENGNCTADLDKNCFIWNGRKSKVILLSRGSILKLRSNNVVTKYLSYDITSDSDSSEIINYLYDDNGDIYACIRKKIVGRQWIIENSSDFSPIPLSLFIKNDEDFIHSFNYHIPEYSLSTIDINLDETKINWDETKINYIALGSCVNEYQHILYNEDYNSRYGHVNIYDKYPNYEKRSVFYSTNMGTTINDVSNLITNPLIIELNINESYKYTNTLEKYSPYLATCIYKWGDIWKDLNFYTWGDVLYDYFNQK